MKEFKSFYSSISDRKFNTWCNYTHRLDPYGCGCQHDCSYCYAKSLLNFRGLWDAGSPSVSNIGKIYSKIKRLPKYDVIKIGGMTDCFQPLEKEKKITLNTIKLLNKYRINYLIVTKSSIVSNPEYLEIYDKDLAHFQITLTSTSDSKSIEYENASLPSERIKSIEKLQKYGFDVSVRLSPFIINYIDLNIINSIECNKILIEFLKVSHWVKKWFDIDYSQYTLKHGGYYHLELDNKIKLVSLVNGFNQLSVGEYVKDHYLYFRDNVNYNKNDCCNLTLKPKEIESQLKLF